MKSPLDKDYEDFLRLHGRSNKGNSLKGLGEHQQEERAATIKTYHDIMIDKQRNEGIADVSYQNKQLAKPSEDGSVTLLSNVIATFDSRFVNGVDFTLSNFDEWSVTSDPPASISLTSTFTIPGGYNAVVRGYRFKMVPDVPVPIDAFVLNIENDGSAIFSMASLRHGTVVDDFIPCFFLVAGGTNVDLNFVASGGIATTITQAAAVPRDISVELIGNYLIQTGAPLEMEIANFEQQQRNIGRKILIGGKG